CDPGIGIVTVTGFIPIQVELAVRIVATTDVLIDEYVTALRVPHRIGDLVRRVVVVRGPNEQSRVATFGRRQVDIRGKRDSVVHRHTDIVQDANLEGGFRELRIPSGCEGHACALRARG